MYAMFGGVALVGGGGGGGVWGDHYVYKLSGDLLTFGRHHNEVTQIVVY